MSKDPSSRNTPDAHGESRNNHGLNPTAQAYNRDGPQVNVARREFLIGSTSALGGAGIIGASLPFILSWKPSARAKALGGPVKVNLDNIKAGNLKVVEWRRKPVYVFRHTQETLAALSFDPERLADPDSKNSDQPSYATNQARSLRPDISVLVGLCTHLGCAPSFAPQKRPEPYDPEWQGGYFCPCHGSKFDLAGRVYRAVPAPTNLTVPAYHFADKSTLVIGQDPPTS
ncbi:MAG: ubiquinol-cytochrome c reductase iron-sulfur subunit [Gammaproteobacteria bacterium]